MRPCFGIAVCTIVVAIAARAQAGPSSADRIYRTVQDHLTSARAAATIQETARRLLNDPQVRSVAALRKFVTGFAAFVSYDRATAERDLVDSFRLDPSPHAAAALAANATEIGHPEPVLHWVEQAFRAGGVTADPLLEVELLVMKAQALGWLTRYDQQRATAADSLHRARASGQPRPLALALRAEAQMLAFSGDKRLAVETFEEALRLSGDAGDVAAVGYHLLLKASTADPNAEAQITSLDAALRAAQQVRDRQLEGRALGLRGAVLLGPGHYDKARHDLSAADTLLRETRALRSRASVAGNLSLLFTELGDYGRAEEQARLATRLYRLVGNPYGARQALEGLGKLALARGNPSLAVSRQEQVVAMTRAWGDRLYLRDALVRLGLAYLAHGKQGAAEQHVREGLRMMDAAGNPGALALAHAALGDVLRQMGRGAEAEHAYREALAMTPQIADSHTLRLRVHHGLGLLESHAGRWTAALAHYRIAIDNIERGRQAVRQPGLQLTYFAEKSALYVDAINTLIEAYRQTTDREHLKQALLFAERAKARTLFDAIAGSAGLAAETDGAIEDIAEMLGPSDLLVEFVTGPSRSFVFTLANDASVTVDQLPARAIIERQVGALREIVTRRPLPGADLERVRRAGSRAYLTLLAPALSQREKLPAVTRLIIVADGLLFYAPFEAFTLPSTGAYLAERFEVVRAASASVLGAMRKRRAAAAVTSSFVAFGDPAVTGTPRPETELVRALERDGFSFARLPGSRREIEAAAAALGSSDTRLYSGESFTSAAVMAELQRPNRIVHFATHAIFDERVPERSGIVLSTSAGGDAPAILRARDLEGLRIPVDLVALSACQTGLGPVVAGEGVLGLTWAFSRAGAASLIVTLWDVSDAASSLTMIAFYRALGAGQSKAAALRTARLDLLRANAALRHPYFWAGYVLIGDPE